MSNLKRIINTSASPSLRLPSSQAKGALKGLFSLPPTVTLIFMGVIAAVFVLDYLVFVPAGVQRFGFDHLVMGKDAGVITEWLCLRTSAVLGGQVWRVVTSALLHGGLIHLLGNCVHLWIAGGLVEREIGGGRFALVLAAGAVFANLCVMRIFQLERGFGASTAIYGAMGMLAALWFARRGHMRAASTRPQLIILLLFVLSNAAADPFTLVEHGGGFIMGIGLALVFT